MSYTRKSPASVAVWTLSVEALGLVPALAVRLRDPRACRAARSRLRIAAAVARSRSCFAAFSTELQPLALHTFLWAHLLQNVVLAEWAPGLLVLAVPPLLGRRAAQLWIFRPLIALPLWLTTYFVWHLP